MVLNIALLTTVARVSAELCQYAGRNPERLSGEQMLELLCCLPLYHLRRLALSLFSFFCFPVTPYSLYYVYSSGYGYYSSSLDSDDDDDDSSDGYDSHSDRGA